MTIAFFYIALGLIVALMADEMHGQEFVKKAWQYKVAILTLVTIWPIVVLVWFFSLMFERR